MKPTLYLLLIPLLPAGCLARPTPVSITLECDQPGTTEVREVDSVGTIGIYLPPCYDPDGIILYPVLYLLPGMGGTYQEWFAAGLAGVVDDLILTGQIPDMIVITTRNTGDDISAPFIVDALIPYVENHFLVSTDRLRRAVAGGSLGGASACYLAIQHPDLFASAGVFGNGLVTGQEEQIDAWLMALPPRQRPRFFLNSGENDTYMLARAQALILLLDRHMIRHAESFSAGGHSTSYWLSNFNVYLPWLAEDWQWPYPED